jgi:biopolymer transport protein ExbB/TolQ
MNTTLMGLVAAIIMMVIHSFLSAKADKIISEIDEYSVKLMDLLLVKEEKES